MRVHITFFYLFLNAITFWESTFSHSHEVCKGSHPCHDDKLLSLSEDGHETVRCLTVKWLLHLRCWLKSNTYLWQHIDLIHSRAIFNRNESEAVGDRSLQWVVLLFNAFLDSADETLQKYISKKFQKAKNLQTILAVEKKRYRPSDSFCTFFFWECRSFLQLVPLKTRQVYPSHPCFHS